MASSKFEIASSSPFGCVLTLKNHNDCDACITHPKNKVRDHVNTCNAVLISSDSTPNQNNKKPTWVSRVAKNNNSESLNFTRRFHNIFGDKYDSSLSALVSPRHSKTIDRWAARQAREVTKNMENNEGVVHDVLQIFPSRSSSFNSRRDREVSVSPPRSDSSFESEKTSNLGASSLVQIWEKRLNQSNCTKQNETSVGRTNSDASSNEMNAFYVEEHNKVLEEGESCDEPFSDWEYDKTGQSSGQPCSPKLHCNSDAAESERSRVADIIKKLSVTNQMQGDDNDHEVSNINVTSSPYRERDRAFTPKQLVEEKGFCQVTSSPRIRGRQAFNDLIMQFESDRRGELNNLVERGAVSKFTQRGRIQSLLRLRLLQRGVAAFDPSHPKSTTFEGNKQLQGSTIMQIRERFNTGDEQRTSSLTKVNNPKQLGKDTVGCKKISDIHNKQNSVAPTSAVMKEEVYPGYGFEAQNDDPKQTIEATSSKIDSKATEMNDKVEEKDQIRFDTIEANYNEILDEKEGNNQNCDKTISSYDWISPISRPRSYWEKLRQEWYKEMLDFGSDNDERRKLLERKTVSTVLSSDFRVRMDNLMNSHMGTQTQLVNNGCNEEDEEGGMEQLMEFFHDRLRVRGNPKEKETEHEDESTNGGSDHELGDYQSSPSVHTPSSTTWSYRDSGGGDDSVHRVAFVSSPLHSQSQSFYQDSRQYSSPSNHHSIEMQFIYDLRGQMEQLSIEMSELRKTIKNCTDMQMQLQQSKKQEVHTVKEKKINNKTSKKVNCCICKENKVNSILYRCGHMCACLECANELQLKSKKCPICQTPIIDVVRVYTDTEYLHDGQTLAVEDYVL